MKSKSDGRLTLRVLTINKKEGNFGDLTPIYSESRIKPDLLPADYYFRRNNKLSVDRLKQTNNLRNSPKAKDVSYLYEVLSRKTSVVSPIYDLSSYPLPAEINELQLLLKSEDYDIENIFKRTKTSRPYGRKDAVNLAIWLEEMHKKYLYKLDAIMETKDIVETELTETVEAIYLIALKESIKQIAVYCIERASMIHRIFEILGYTWKKSPDDLQRKIESIKLKNHQELARFKNKYNMKYELLEKTCEELKQKLEESNKEQELLKNETNILKKHINQMRSDNENRKYDRGLSRSYKKLTEEIGIQTDPEPETESSEESSSDEGPVPSIVDQVTITRMLTRQRSIAPDKRPENLLHLKKHIDLANCSGQFVIEDLYQYITSEYIDFYAWVDGFRLAAEVIQNKSKSDEITGDSSRKTETIDNNANNEAQLTEIKVEEKKKTSKYSKKFFKFKPNVTIAKQLAENSPNELILNELSEWSMKKIIKNSTLTSRKVSNQINYFINIARNQSFDQFPTFSIYVYGLLFQKYSLKHIVDRKFQELIASCIKNHEAIKVQIFLRMIGAGENAKLKNFSHTSSKMCIRLYDFMMSDKTGIMVECKNNDFYPISRAYECIKQIFDPIFTRADMLKLKRKTESLLMTDPDEINKAGIIDLHSFILNAVEIYQEYTEKVYDGVINSAKVLTEFKYITWEEANVLVRNINPKKELKEQDRVIIEMNQTDEIELDNFQEFCVQKGVLRIEDFDRFFSRPHLNHHEIIEKIKEIKEILPDLLDTCEDIATTLSYDDWDGRFDDITIGLKGKSQDNAFKLWTLLYSEFQSLSLIGKKNL